MLGKSAWWKSRENEIEVKKIEVNWESWSEKRSKRESKNVNKLRNYLKLLKILI